VDQYGTNSSEKYAAAMMESCAALTGGSDRQFAALCYAQGMTSYLYPQAFAFLIMPSFSTVA